MTVATRYYSTDVRLYPGSTPDAPIVFNVPLPDILLRSVDVRVPPGPSGNVGFYMTLAGTPIIPWGIPPVYLILDDEPAHFDVGTEAQNGVGIVGYNTGAWIHTLYFRFVGTPMSLVPAAIPIATIVPIS